MTSNGEAHKRLGQALRNARESIGLSTRQVPKNDPDHPYFSSGHISLVEQGRTVPSPELIETYIRLSGRGAELSSLYEQMGAASQLAARRRRQPEGSEALPVPPQRMDDVRDRHDVQRHYIVEQNEARYIFGPTGSIQRVECKVTLRAKTPGVRICYGGYSYPADQRRGILHIEVTGGAIIEEIRESDNGAVQTFFRLNKTLLPTDDPYMISFRVHVKSLVRSAPHLRFHAEAGNRKLILHAEFQPPALPHALWMIEAPSIIDAALPQDGSNVMHESTGTYSRNFDQLVPGWCYGFGWRWS
jgi:hypothetical protein